jgi:serine/threonine protein kinase
MKIRHRAQKVGIHFMSRLTAWLTPIPFDVFTGQQLLNTSDNISIFRSTRSDTGEFVFLNHKRVTFIDDSGNEVNDEIICEQICQFLRTVGNPLRIASPCLLNPVGWNVQITADGKAMDFFWIAPFHRSAAEVRLNHTEKQIMFYGVLKALQALNSIQLFHNDLSLADVLLDEQKYPVIARSALTTLPLKSHELQEMSPASISHLCPLVFMISSQWKLAQLRKNQEWNVSMILYQLLEEKPIELEIEPGETIVTSIVSGKRPTISRKSERFRGMLENIWAEKRQEIGLDQLIQEFENPDGWVPGTNRQAFYQYKAYINYYQEKGEGIRLIESVLEKLDVKICEDKVRRGSSMIEKVALLFEWLNGPEFYDPILESLRIKGTLDPQLLTIIEPPRPVPCLFTTALFDCSTFMIIERIGENTWKVVKQSEREIYVLKRIPIEKDTVKFVVHYLKQILSFSVGHPVLLPLIGWNAISGESQTPEIHLLTKFVSQGSLQITSVATYSLTDQWIILYGIARALAFLHSHRIIHGNLNPNSILLESDRRPILSDLGFPKWCQAPIPEKFS